MRKSKPNTERPWLTSTDVELPTAELKKISKSWGPATWAAYLKWYESGCRELLIAPTTYQRVGEEQIANIFETCGNETSPADQQTCERALNSLPKLEAQVLRHLFFDGHTVREIAALEDLPKSTVHDLKNRALSRLKRGIHGDHSDAQQFMEGEDSDPDSEELSIWDVSLVEPIREPRTYRPEDQSKTIEQLKFDSLKTVLSELSERQRRIIYLRYWCDLSYSAIARELRIGLNTVADIDEATVFKIKSRVLDLEIQKLSGGESCA